MTQDEFWTVIEQAKRGAASVDARPGELRRLLEDETPSRIHAFDALYMERIDAACTWPLWGAAFVIMGGCSDDGFDYFRDWLVCEGRAVFERALADPESLAELPALGEPELELLRYVAQEVYEGKTGRHLVRSPGESRGDPAGEAWDEDSVAELYPRLAALYW